MQPTIEQLYDRHFDAIFRYVVRRVGNVAEAEDVTAQTFFKAARSLDRSELGRENPLAWLYRIATNELRDGARRRMTVDRSEPLLRATEAAAVRAERESADAALARNRVFSDLHAALATLEQDEQALVALRFFEALPFPEIATIVGAKSSTVAMRTHRALKKLKATLESRGIHHDEIRGLFAEDAAPRPAGRRVQAGATT